VIPACNEADNVPKLARELTPVLVDLAQTRSVEVVFVDDGSVDETWLALNTAFGRAQVPGVSFCFERHRVNRGLGAAIRTGLAAARGEIMITTDADGTYKFETIPALLARMTPEVDIVTASPYHPQGGVENVPGYRLVLSQGSSLVYRLLVSWKVHTYTALFRAYRRRVVEKVAFGADGFLGGTELMVKAMLLGYKVAEYPATLHARVFGSSKAKIVRTIREHLKFQWRVLLHRLHLNPLVRAGKIEGKLEWTR
jgi:dolichol-phosphate mannosyltransferase